MGNAPPGFPGAVHAKDDDEEQEELIARFREQRTCEHFSSTGIKGKGSGKGRPGSIADAKSWTSSLAPICIKELIADSTHKGKVLLGKVAVDHAFYTGSSAAFVFEDMFGRVAKFAVYGIVHNTQQAEKVFAKGTLLAVREPHYKVRMDGTLGVRVDEPSDLSKWPFPATALDWKNLGNRFFRDSRSCFGAVRSYQKGVQAAGEATSVSLLLSNCSECCLRLDRLDDAARFAVVAAALDFSNVKAWVRLVKASLQLRGEASAKAVAAHSITTVQVRGSKDQVKLVKDELAKLVDLTSTAAAGKDAPRWTDTLWWCQGKALSAPWCAHPKWIDPELGSWGDLRLAGGEAFGKSDFDKALGHFVSAVKCFTKFLQDIAFFFSNMAAARFLDSSTSPDASIDGLFESSLAALLDFRQPKAWLRQSRFLEKLGSHGAALNRLQWAIDRLGKEADEDFTKTLAEEVSELRGRASHSACAPSMSSVSTDQQLKERQDNELLQGGVRDEESLDDEIISLENVVMMARMTTGLPQAKGKAKAKAKAKANLAGPSLPSPFADLPCPEIHVEFAQMVGWPAGINATMAKKVLYRTYLNGSLQPWFEESCFRDGSKSFDFQMAMKRWQGPFALQEIAASSKPLNIGDVVDTRSKYPRSFDQRIRSSFANNPCNRETMFLGTTHVALGFNDLITLLTGKVSAAPEPEHRGRPLTFLGLEMSEFSVAKFLVVAEMLAGKCPLDLVLQVWYSSCWTMAVLEPFRAACKTLHSRMVANKGKTRPGSTSFNLYSEGVAMYLEHWMVVRPISAERARQQWLQGSLRHTGFFTGIPSLCQQKDRLAATRYLITGEVPVSGVTEIGSLPMWSVPEGSPPLEKDQIFNTFDVAYYIGARVKQPKLDIVELFNSLVLERLAQMRQLLHQDQLRIELFLGKVVPLGESREGDLLADDIAALRPYGVSWYNVIDYFEKTAFHNLARHISQHGDVMHFAYSMNWTIEVFGTCLADYLPGTPTVNPDDLGGPRPSQSSSSKKKKKKNGQKTRSFDPDPEEAALDQVNSLLDAALGAEANLDAHMSGMNTLFTVPFHDTPLNIVGSGLATVLHPRWLDHFYNLAAMSKMTKCKRTPNNSGLTRAEHGEEVIKMCPLHRNHVTLYTSWTYDPNLPLQCSG